MSFNKENRLHYHDLAPSLRELIDVSLTTADFIFHKNSNDIHITPEERMYWNTIEFLVKKYCDANKDAVKSKMDKDISNLSNTTSAELNKISKFALTASFNDLKDTPTTFIEGEIAWYYGDTSKIPSEWHICDGTNGTPDLRDRFLVGVGPSYGLGTTGGVNSCILGENNMPPHRHTFPGDDELVYICDTYGFPTQRIVRNWDWESHNDGNQSRIYWMGATGGSVGHENRPLFYSLVLIMYKG